MVLSLLVHNLAHTARRSQVALDPVCQFASSVSLTFIHDVNAAPKVERDTAYIIYESPALLRN
ncbi:MAG: hypothetical protein B6D39_02105 [Anaerolineae bacterium UTCFX2]|nr:MAG: hypothetical protein B6D39_02105 [Anaerolineae bacterium UTCFX2]